MKQQTMGQILMGSCKQLNAKDKLSIPKEHFAQTQYFTVALQETASDVKLSSQGCTKRPCLHQRSDSLHTEELSCMEGITAITACCRQEITR